MFEALADFVDRWRERRLLKRCGSICQCPWCLQWTQDGDGGSIGPWQSDLQVDVITCGVCKGRSLWRWEMLFIFIAPLDPPPSKHKPVDWYDVENACLKPHPAVGGG